MTMNETGKKTAREAMPMTAALVDELRQALGREFVDGAIAAGQRARRQHQRMVLTVGQQEADAWLRRQQFPGGAFFAEENGHEVGVPLIHDEVAKC